MKNSEILKLIENKLKNNELHHAFLIFNDNSENLMNFSKLIIKIFNEINSKIQETSDWNISPKNEKISKEDIKNLLQIFSLKSVYEDKRFYFIYDADFLSNSAANAFLKFLEEPNEGVYGFLFTTKIEKIISTIKSRCMLLKIEKENKVKKKYIIDELTKNNLPIISRKISKENTNAIIDEFNYFYDIHKNKFNFQQTNDFKNLLNKITLIKPVSIIIFLIFLIINEVINENN